MRVRDKINNKIKKEIKHYLQPKLMSIYFSIKLIEKDKIASDKNCNKPTDFHFISQKLNMGPVIIANN